MGAPVVADERHMNHILGLDQFPAAQEEVDILGSVKFRTQSARLLNNTPADHAEVMRVVVGDRHFRTPAAFELGIVTAAGVIDFVFVGVKITRRWLARDR